MAVNSNVILNTGLNSPDLSKQDEQWKPLAFLNLYRTLIAATFLFLAITDTLYAPLASSNPFVFTQTNLAYLIIASVYWLAIHTRKPGITIQIYLGVTLDIVATIIFIQTSGGVESGLGTLLIISLAGSGILLPTRSALLFASIATLAILASQVYAQYATGTSASGYVYAGILGITFFTTTLLANRLTMRMYASEALAQRRSVDLANMAKLTEHIIQRMQTGIIVVDDNYTVRLINESAWHMLGMPSTLSNPNLKDISGELSTQIHHWRNDNDIPSRVVKPSPMHAEVMPRFARIGQNENSGTLVFLEDQSVMAQRAQQLQLAALGRLTASIAHEVRNPLGAISHAGQLLAESENLDENDIRLTDIIATQSQRMNTIVENIMQLGRRDHTKPEIFELKPMLNTFLNTFSGGHSVNATDIKIDIQPADAMIRFDKSHLEQILTNLLENGLRHAADYNGTPKVEVRGGVTLEFNRPFLDIIDHGTGIDTETAQHIFEPFFTTESTGSGLGLYISRELAECNQAHMNYIPIASGGSCFRITFQDPRRQIS